MLPFNSRYRFASTALVTTLVRVILSRLEKPLAGLRDVADFRTSSRSSFFAVLLISTPAP